MPFADEVPRAAWARAGGRCECRQSGHGHADPCARELVWERRGPGGWELYVPLPITGPPAEEDASILCWACYEAVNRRDDE
jgi:hypothetical protein